MCDYCKLKTYYNEDRTERVLRSSSINGESLTLILYRYKVKETDINESDLILMLSNNNPYSIKELTNVHINYCPFCGQKLWVRVLNKGSFFFLFRVFYMPLYEKNFILKGAKIMKNFKNVKNVVKENKMTVLSMASSTLKMVGHILQLVVIFNDIKNNK